MEQRGPSEILVEGGGWVCTELVSPAGLVSGILGLDVRIVRIGAFMGWWHRAPGADGGPGFLHVLLREGSAPLKGRLGCAGASMQRELGTVLCTNSACALVLPLGQPPLSRERGADHILSLSRLLRVAEAAGAGMCAHI